MKHVEADGLDMGCGHHRLGGGRGDLPAVPEQAARGVGVCAGGGVYAGVAVLSNAKAIARLRLVQIVDEVQLSPVFISVSVTLIAA